MTDDIKQIIEATVTATILKLKAAGIIQDGQKTAIEKTEALLYQYTQLRETDQPYARRVVQEIDAALEGLKNDPFVDVIRLHYFEGQTYEACANELYCSRRTVTRKCTALVERLSARLLADDFIRELLL